jgi:hypothetical protein
MPSCNLAETMHNKWLQASGNRGNDLYVATVDDYIRAFMQVVAYYQFLKGDVGGSGPCKNELKLRNAQRRARNTGDPRVLKEAMLDMPGADEFCIRDPHLEGEEVFGSTKRKPDLPLGDDGESHRPDTVNYSRPRGLKRAALERVASLPVIAEEEESEAPEVIASPVIPSSPPVLEGGIQHITAVQESTVNERLWHIARLSKTSAKLCWAMRAVTKKKCDAKIVRNSTNTPAPTYTGEWLNVRLGREISEQFFFCPDDIDRCVKGTRRKWVRHFSSTEPRPPIPDVWPVKLGTNLKLKEIQALEVAGFQLPQKIQVSPRRLFSNAPLPSDMSTVPVPSDADRYPGKRKSKKVRRQANVPTSKQCLSIDSSKILKARLYGVTMVPHPGYGCIIALDSGTPPAVTQYQITVSSEPACTCPAFKQTMVKFGKKGGYFSYCKHIYYVFIKVCKRDPNVDLFMHAPTFSFNEIKLLLESGILTRSNS